MIVSMTAFGSARVETASGAVTIEYRGVNNRFLDVGFRLPEDLRSLETALREQIGKVVRRGKIDMRLTYALSGQRVARSLDAGVLRQVAEQLALARQVLPDTPSPRLDELLHASGGGAESSAFDLDVWGPMCLQASEQALREFHDNRVREGARLAQAMLVLAEQIGGIVEQVAQEQPALLAEHQAKVSRKLHDALLSASPDGFAQISGAELSARIAQESSLFALRVDVAEELTRLRSHVQELRDILGGGVSGAANAKAARTGSIGKRLDFLFQEMNREANTLGSKSASTLVTGAAIDLKLLIEQLREQAQNIE